MTTIATPINAVLGISEEGVNSLLRRKLQPRDDGRFERAWTTASEIGREPHFAHRYLCKKCYASYNARGLPYQLQIECSFMGVLEMASAITREIIEIVAAMQAKAWAFDSEHPNHVLDSRTAAEYAEAIRALVPVQEQLQVGELMLAAGAQALRLLLLSCADTRSAT